MRINHLVRVRLRTISTGQKNTMSKDIFDHMEQGMNRMGTILVGFIDSNSPIQEKVLTSLGLGALIVFALLWYFLT